MFVILILLKSIDIYSKGFYFHFSIIKDALSNLDLFSISSSTVFN